MMLINITFQHPIYLFASGMFNKLPLTRALPDNLCQICYDFKDFFEDPVNQVRILSIL